MSLIRTSRHAFAGLALVLAALAMAPAWASDDELITQEFLVELLPGADPQDVAQRKQLELLESLPALHLYLYFDPLAREANSFAAELELEPDILDAEGHRRFDNPEGGQRTIPVLDRTVLPDEMDKQLSFTSIGGPVALTRHDGSGSLVAVVDTGMSLVHPRTHDALTGDSADIVSGSGSAAVQANGIDDDADGSVDESVHHATFVTGIVNLSASGARVLPVRVLDADGRGSSFDVARGILFAVKRGADVINLSLGMLWESEVIDAAVDHALDKGVVVVAAAGNRSLDRADFPGTLSGVITVAAVDEVFAKTPFSSFGPTIDLTAPGVNLLSTWGDADYGRWAGTSFAAPFVSGAVALLIERYPGLSPAEIEQVLRDTSQPDAAGSIYEGLLGAGVLDMDAMTQIVTSDASSLRLERIGGSTRLTWSPVLGLASFDLLRGDPRELSHSAPDRVDLGQVVCLQDDVASEPHRIEAFDATRPEPGEAFFYVFRDRADELATGYGEGSSEDARYPSVGDCPDPD